MFLLRGAEPAAEGRGRVAPRLVRSPEGGGEAIQFVVPGLTVHGPQRCSEYVIVFKCLASHTCCKDVDGVLGSLGFCEGSFEA